MVCTMAAGLIGWRLAGSSVSGSRSQVQASTSAPSTAIIPKIQRQPATSSTAWPSVGAIIGTVMNTMVIVDCSRAIRSPS